MRWNVLEVNLSDWPLGGFGSDFPENKLIELLAHHTHCARVFSGSNSLSRSTALCWAASLLSLAIWGDRGVTSQCQWTSDLRSTAPLVDRPCCPPKSVSALCSSACVSAVRTKRQKQPSLTVRKARIFLLKWRVLSVSGRILSPVGCL